MVCVHPITLKFDHDDMERELRAGTLDASYCALVLFIVLDVLCRAIFPLSNVMFDPASETNTAIAYTCIAGTYATVLYVLRYAQTLPAHEAAACHDQLWMITWVINVAVWWGMLLCGLTRRLVPTEGQAAAVICAMWGFVMVIQHALHIGFVPRMGVILVAIINALTSVAWRTELLAALVFGEALGYSMEHMVRTSYLSRAKTLAKNLEQVRMAKERSDYDLKMLTHSHGRGRYASPASSAASSRSKSDSSNMTVHSGSREPLSELAFAHGNRVT